MGGTQPPLNDGLGRSALKAAAPLPRLIYHRSVYLSTENLSLSLKFLSVCPQPVLANRRRRCCPC